MLNRSHSDKEGSKECSYCKGTRNTYEGEEGEGKLEYFKTGMSSTKLRVDDYEYLVERGFTRCGTYLYAKNM
jgi:hypothetical protein